MNRDYSARPGAPNQPDRAGTRRPRRVPRAVTVGVTALATTADVHLDLNVPSQSPVSPTALAARYGPPSASSRSEVTAMFPAESAAAPAAAPGAVAHPEPAATVDLTPQAIPSERQRGQHNGGGHD